MSNISRLLEGHMFGPADKFTIRNVEADIKQKYPGDYSVICNEIEGGLSAEFNFIDESERLIWELKYGYN